MAPWWEAGVGRELPAETPSGPLGALIEGERQRRSWTRRELASRVCRAGRVEGVALTTTEKAVERWERRGAVPLPAVLRALAAALERPVEDLTALTPHGGFMSQTIATAPLRGSLPVVIRRPQTLLLRRRDNGLWQWPAGIVKPEADPRRVAIDCTLSETGVSVTVERSIGERV